MLVLTSPPPSKLPLSTDIMGRRIKAVFSGEHYEGMVMMALSLVFTVMFILVLPQAGDDLEGIEYAALAL